MSGFHLTLTPTPGHRGWDACFTLGGGTLEAWIDIPAVTPPEPFPTGTIASMGPPRRVLLPFAATGSPLAVLHPGLLTAEATTAFFREALSGVVVSSLSELRTKLMHLIRFFWTDPDDSHMVHYTHSDTRTPVRVTRWKLHSATSITSAGRAQPVSLRSLAWGPHRRQLTLRYLIQLGDEQWRPVRLRFIHPDRFAEQVPEGITRLTHHALCVANEIALRAEIQPLLRGMRARSVEAALLKLALYFDVGDLAPLLARPWGEQCHTIGKIRVAV